ncbi:hypothetical protein [Paenibacillus durus]|uniref:hypothetical protein n=1 Tax=Paenibacillus durus TaxID=44251 RepID=UPI0012E00FD8|nr:hypothetical protein [Paenibacillus durus]
MSEKNKVTFLPIKNKTILLYSLKKVARNITLSSSTPIVKCQHDLSIPASTLQHPKMTLSIQKNIQNRHFTYLLFTLFYSSDIL